MTNDKNILRKSLLEILENKKYRTLKDVLVTINPADLAEIMDGLEDSIITLLFRLLNKDQAAETFVDMDTTIQESLIRAFSDNELKTIMDMLFVDDVADLLEEMPANVVKRILEQTESKRRNEINEILRYPEESA